MSKHHNIMIKDCIIMIVATAFGLALYRVYEPIEESGLHKPLILNTTPIVSMWTFALVILRLQKPRPRLRWIFRQPGMAACSTAVIAMSVYFPLRIRGLIMVAGGPGSEFQGAGVWYGTVFREHLYLIGFSVLAVWLNLAMSGRWSAEKSWIDRLGRLFAAYWIGIALLAVFQI
jgi:hypothetical protein